MTDFDKLQLAIDKAREGLATGNDGYGAAIFDGHVLVACAHNRVATSGDPTAHAEVEAISAAYAAADPAVLARSVLFSSCEPCPMCLGTIRWVGIPEVVYGAADAEYGGVDSGATGVVRTRARHLASREADEIAELARRRWQTRHPRPPAG